MGKPKNILILFGVLGLPLVIFLFLKGAKHNFQRLPIYGERYYDEQLKDTVYHTISDFELYSQTGAKVSLEQLHGKISIANFFFARCPDICPKMNEQMSRVYQEYKEVDQIRFISHTVDPTHDSVAVLATYAKQFDADPNRWFFVTGEEQAIFDLGTKGYLLPGSVEDSVIDHSQNLVLIDKESRIRGVYDGLDFKDVDKLIDEVKVLLYEYKERDAEK